MSATPPPGTKPKLSRSATPAERQAAALNRLLAHPDREVRIPQRPQEGATKTLRAPRDMMKNVQGSSAGADSGEFVSRPPSPLSSSVLNRVGALRRGRSGRLHASVHHGR